MRFPGSVSITPDVFKAVVQQVALSAISAGFKNVYVMGDHGGGQDELKSAASEIMFLDTARKWIRRDKLAASDSTQQAVTGVDGDPTKATASMGRMFLDLKVRNAVEQIRRLRTERLRGD